MALSQAPNEVLLHFTLTGDYRRLIRTDCTFPPQLQYCTHPHSIITCLILSKMKLLNGSAAAEGLHAVCPFYRVPKHSSIIAQKHCISRDTARQLLRTRTSRIYGITDFAWMQRKGKHSSVSVARPCAENRSTSSRTRRRNANLCTLPISLLSVLTAANGTTHAQDNSFCLLTA